MGNFTDYCNLIKLGQSLNIAHLIGGKPVGPVHTPPSTLHLAEVAGTGSNGAKIENSNVDGSSVFFTTTDALAPQDEEPGVTKLYVAREGGGVARGG